MTEAKQLTGKHVLLIFLAGLSVVLAANVTFITLAVTTFTGQTVENPYEDGLAYNEVLQARAAQAQLGWSAVYETQTVDGLTSIAVNLTDRGNIPVPGAAVSVTFRRPTNDGLDSSIQLAEGPTGTYTAALTLPAPGNWDVIGQVNRDETERMEFETRIFISE